MSDDISMDIKSLLKWKERDVNMPTIPRSRGLFPTAEFGGAKNGARRRSICGAEDFSHGKINMSPSAIDAKSRLFAVWTAE